ncbi:hypothetical protein PsorP6_007105 [Peronosclerospora sorghi]|uniref:Uncharacterized protein n=1 Tax=Peronosclerospora sorghi TaxID=230839 RepID=A0ACC0W942_9STRA|nr:hypothetical protein PsorP6_007105 [Peronosclerospora sorghi]
MRAPFVHGATTFLALGVLTAATETQRIDPDSWPLNTSFADLPSLKLHVSYPRRTVKVHGASEFDVFANPVVDSTEGNRVRYDGYATFLDGHAQVTYALVNGAPFMVTRNRVSKETSVHCMRTSPLPFNEILPVLNDATPIASASIGQERIVCKSGQLFRATFVGIQYAICASGGSGFTIVSSDVTIDGVLLDTRVQMPEIKWSHRSKCGERAKATQLTPTALALLRGREVPESTTRLLREASHMSMAASTCGCKSKSRPCLFFHGLGNEKDEPGVKDSSRHFGWNFIQGHAPCCTTIKYAALNTVDYPWTSAELQDKVCDRSLSMAATSNSYLKIIEDTIIVTHSMGGLMFAGALANRKCRLAKSSTWIALSAPMIGSMSSDYLIDYCDGKAQNFFTDLMFGGKCPVNASIKSVVYQYEKYCDNQLQAAYKAAQESYRQNVYAAMCSSSYVGNISKFQPKYMMGGHFIPHKSPENDGLVEFLSCAGGIDPANFGPTPQNKFYRCELNHADTAFKTGDGLFKTTVRPITWFECLL